MSKKNSFKCSFFVLFFCLLLLESAGYLKVEAVTTTNNSLSLTNSIPGTVATHTITFLPSDTADTVKYIKLQYATTATGSVTPTGLSMSATPTVTISNNGTNVPNSATYASGLVTITLTSATALTSSGSGVSIAIASVTNPNAGVFFIQLNAYLSDNTTVTDNGVTESVTVPGVALSGTVNPSLTFSITGIASGTGTGTTNAQNTTTGPSTSSSISFGSMTAGTNSVSQLITTTTNAQNGYSVEVEENRAPTGPGGATIANLGANTTWSNGSTLGFGVNATNGTNGDIGTTFSANTLYAPIPVNTPTLVLASKASSTNLAGDNEYINYQIGASSALSAGTYSNTIDYVVISNF